MIPDIVLNSLSPQTHTQPVRVREVAFERLQIIETKSKVQVILRHPNIHVSVWTCTVSSTVATVAPASLQMGDRNQLETLTGAGPWFLKPD